MSLARIEPASLEPEEAPLELEERAPAPVAIPPYVVAAIADAAVAAYIERQREERRAYDRAYRKVNAERLREQARARYARRRPHSA